MAAERPADSVAPLERGLAVLRAVCSSPEEQVRPGDLARATGLARSTVDRVLSTLIRLDYLRGEGRDVALAPRAMEFGRAYLAASGLPELLEPLAVRLADALDESVSVAVPDRGRARFVVQVTRRRTMSLAFQVGDWLPAERCAAGLLFNLRSNDAWALDDQLIEPGLIAVAVPIREAGGGRVVCALSVVSHTSRHTAESLRDHALPRMQETAQAMEAALAKAGPHGDPRSPRAGRESACDHAHSYRLTTPASGIDDAKQDLGPQYLRSLARGLAVLTALGGRRGGMPLSAVADAAELPRATARRALITLHQEGYVGHPDPEGRLFAPLPTVLELGYARILSRGAEDLVRPHLTRLTRQVHESASVAVLCGPDISYVARVATSRIMQVVITVGTRFPAYATSMGRVLLAALPEPERKARIAATRLEPLTRFTVTDPDALAEILSGVAENGYALVDQELEEGLRSMAVPLRDCHSRVVAALNVSMHAGRDDPQHAREAILPAMMETAARISDDLAAMGDRLNLASL
jgi:IclR family transcriptional regulator, pca regulon regulatory protein